MGEEGSHEIPCLDFSGVGSDKESRAWKVLRGKVREACESHGCFMVNYGTDKITGELREEMFMATKHLFDLPLETKEKHSSPGHDDRYMRPISSMLHESFGIKSSHQLHVARAFSNLMWPSDGNPNFCELLSSISSKFLELNLIIMKMIFESFDMENYYEFVKENNTTHLRLMKYNPPPSNDTELGIAPHTDENFLTTLCQHEVQGLEVLSKQGNWIQAIIPDGYYFVVVGDALKAWSNGRLPAAKHRVMMRGGKERFSLGSFLAPTDETIIEAPRKLVDENHPLVYRPYTFSEYIQFLVSNNYPEEAVELYAGI